MAETYQAVLRGNHLGGRGETPEAVEAGQPVDVVVIMLKEPEAASKKETQGKRMAEALEKLAAIHALSEISDPSAWQREQRQDRSLPGRDV